MYPAWSRSQNFSTGTYIYEEYLFIPSQAFLLGPHSMESGEKLIKCPHSFKVKFDPISVTIPFQEPFISWMDTQIYLCWTRLSCQSRPLCPSRCGAALSSCCYMAITALPLPEGSMDSPLDHSVLFLPVYLSPHLPPPGVLSDSDFCSGWVSLAPGQVKWPVQEWRTVLQERSWACKIIFLLHNTNLHAINYFFFCIHSLKNSIHL